MAGASLIAPIDDIVSVLDEVALHAALPLGALLQALAPSVAHALVGVAAGALALLAVSAVSR